MYSSYIRSILYQMYQSVQDFSSVIHVDNSMRFGLNVTVVCRIEKCPFLQEFYSYNFLLTNNYIHYLHCKGCTR